MWLVQGIIKILKKNNCVFYSTETKHLQKVKARGKKEFQNRGVTNIVKIS